MAEFKKYNVTILKGSIPEVGLEYWTKEDWDRHSENVAKLKESGEYLKPQYIELIMEYNELYDKPNISESALPYRFEVLDFSKILK